jgi:hypothetical protein
VKTTPQERQREKLSASPNIANARQPSKKAKRIQWHPSNAARMTSFNNSAHLCGTPRRMAGPALRRGSPPFPVHIWFLAGDPFHFLGGQELIILGMRIAEEHDHAVFPAVIVPDMAFVQDIAIGVPDPIALNDFAGRLERDFGLFDGNIVSVVFHPADLFHFVIIKSELFPY